jgi:hypothetical protein
VTSDVSIVLTSNHPAHNGGPRNSVEVRVGGVPIVQSYEHETPVEAYEEVIRMLIELLGSDDYSDPFGGKAGQ